MYWCEGSKRKRDRRVEFVNSDPDMLRVFMRYLRFKRVEERRIRARMMIHIQDVEDECREFWQGVTGLGESNFISTVVRPQGKAKKHLPYGVLTIRYNSVELLSEVKSDIKNLTDILVSRTGPPTRSCSSPA